MTKYEFYIGTELRDLDNEQKKVNRHLDWIETAEKYKNCAINWQIYWSRYRHNEIYSPKEVIEILMELED